jgi:hypothetical protein
MNINLTKLERNHVILASVATTAQDITPKTYCQAISKNKTNLLTI